MDNCLEEQAIVWIGHVLRMGLDWGWGVMNSNFGIAATGSFFGAVGGYFLVEYNRFRENIQNKVSHINAATSLSLDVFNTMLSFKKQHAKMLYEAYLADREKLIAARQIAPNINSPIQVNYLADFRTIRFPSLPIELLYKTAQEKINLVGRSLLLVSVLVRVIESLKDAIITREALIKEIAAIGADEKAKAYFYFGLPWGDRRDERYLDTIRGIYDLTDDTIMFSQLLLDALVINGEKTAKKLWFNRPVVMRPTIKVIEDGLMPNQEKYKDWTDNIKLS